MVVDGGWCVLILKAGMRGELRLCAVKWAWIPNVSFDMHIIALM